MFGEIEDLANAGSFEDQVHSDPTLFINFGGDNDEAEGDDDDDGKTKAGGDDDDNVKVARLLSPPRRDSL